MNTYTRLLHKHSSLWYYFTMFIGSLDWFNLAHEHGYPLVGYLAIPWFAFVVYLGTKEKIEDLIPDPRPEFRRKVKDFQDSIRGELGYSQNTIDAYAIEPGIDKVKDHVRTLEYVLYQHERVFGDATQPPETSDIEDLIK